MKLRLGFPLLFFLFYIHTCIYRCRCRCVIGGEVRRTLLTAELIDDVKCGARGEPLSVPNSKVNVNALPISL
jgi:hypothetical protein